MSYSSKAHRATAQALRLMMSFIYSYRFLRFFVEAALSLASYMRSESSNEPHCRMHIANSISLPLQLHITGLRRICVRQLLGYVAQSEPLPCMFGMHARPVCPLHPRRSACTVKFQKRLMLQHLIFYKRVAERAATARPGAPPSSCISIDHYIIMHGFR